MIVYNARPTPPVLSGRRWRRRGQRPVGRLLPLLTLPRGQLWRLGRLSRNFGLSDFIIVSRNLGWGLCRGFCRLLGWKRGRRMRGWRLGGGDLVKDNNVTSSLDQFRFIDLFTFCYLSLCSHLNAKYVQCSNDTRFICSVRPW